MCPAVLPEPRCGGAGLEGRAHFSFIRSLGVDCRLPATLSLQDPRQEWGSLTPLTQPSLLVLGYSPDIHHQAAASPWWS